MDVIGNQLFKCFFSFEFFSTEVLTPKERILSFVWSEKRTREFCTGRYCARNALLALGVHLNITDILIGPCREPIWPDKVVGSISHSDNLVGALVSTSEKLWSIGVDVETIGRIDKALWSLIFTMNERKWLLENNDDKIDLYSTLIFSAKECFYKLQYPLTKKYIGFMDVEVLVRDSVMELNLKNMIFSESYYYFNNVQIHYLLIGSEVVTYASLPRIY